MKLDALGRLLLLAAIWGGSFLFTRIAAPSFGPVPLIFLRVSSAALLLVPFALMRHQLPSLRAHAGKLFLLGIFNSALPFSLLAYATLHLGAGLGSVLNATAPLWGALLSFLILQERASVAKAFGLALGFSGVALLVFAGSNDAPSWSSLPAWLPTCAALAATFLYALSALASKRYLADVSPLAVSAGSQAGATAVTIPFALALWPAQAAPASAWASALALGVACTAVAYLLYFRMIAEGGAARGLAVTYLIPVFGVLWGVLFLKESVTWGMAAAALVVLAGTALSSGVLRSQRNGLSHSKGDRE